MSFIGVPSALPTVSRAETEPFAGSSRRRAPIRAAVTGQGSIARNRRIPGVSSDTTGKYGRANSRFHH